MQPDASPPGVNIGSVVQALRGNSSRTLLLVRNGSDWTFQLDRILSSGIADPIAENLERWEGLPDVMSQVVPFEVNDERRTSGVVFSRIWDGDDVLSMALCEAMRTNKTVQSLELIVDDLEGPHLTAIVDSLLENDTLESFSMRPRCTITCPIEDVSAAFEHIMRRNMCLQDLHIYNVEPVPGLAHDAESELLDPFLGLEFDEEGNPVWPVPLGDTVGEAVDRNEQAWTVAKHLGQLNRSSMDGCQHLGDIGFRRQILVFFLHKDCQAPPRQMLHIAGGLPVWRPVCRDAR